MMKYKALTLLIIILGRLRARIASGIWMGLVKDSPLIKDDITADELEDRGVLIICCDCGLEHRLFRHKVLSPFREREKDLLKAWPLRPVRYDYSCRRSWR